MLNAHRHAALKITRQVAKDGILNRHSLHYYAETRMPSSILAEAVSEGRSIFNASRKA